MRRAGPALVAIIALALPACGVPTEDRATFAPDEEVPFGLLGTAPSTVPEVSAETQPLCLARDGRLEVIEHPLAPPVTPLRLLQAAATPLPEQRQQGLTTALTDDVVTDATSSGTTVTVALSPELPKLAADVQLLAVAQIVCTLTAQPGIGAVRFTVEGSAVEVPRGDGSSTSDPVSADDYRQLLPR